VLEKLPLRKKSFLSPNDNSVCDFTQFLTGRKHGQSLEAFEHGFYCSIAKRSLQRQCKNYPEKFTVRRKLGHTIALLLNTLLEMTQSHPRCTKFYSPPVNGQSPHCCNGSLLYGFNVAIKGLTQRGGLWQRCKFPGRVRAPQG